MNKLGKIKSWYIDPDDIRLTYTQHNILFVNIIDGDSEHDMSVDFDNFVNTGSPDVFFAGAKRQVGYDEPDLDNFIDNLNDWD